jgi:hypothetical protein
MQIETVVFTISVLLAIAGLIAAITFYNLKKDEAIQSGIQTAIEKGIDPLAVRCAYSNGEDKLCLVYAASNRLK